MGEEGFEVNVNNFFFLILGLENEVNNDSDKLLSQPQESHVTLVSF